MYGVRGSWLPKVNNFSVYVKFIVVWNSYLFVALRMNLRSFNEVFYDRLFELLFEFWIVLEYVRWNFDYLHFYDST